MRRDQEDSRPLAPVLGLRYDPIVSNFPQHRVGRVLFVVQPDNSLPTVHIRGLIYQDLFRERGWTVKFISRTPWADELGDMGTEQRDRAIIEMAAAYDVVYLLKVPALSLVKQLRQHTPAAVVFDLTDTLWKPYYRAFGWHQLEEILVRCDAVFSENEWICAFGRRWNDRVVSIPACTQVELFDAARDTATARADGKTVIGWVGSPATVCALAKVFEPLERLAQRHPGLELRVLGSGDGRDLPPFRHLRVTTLPDYDMAVLIREVLWFDIGIFPPPMDMEDFVVRGALKAMIYMTGGIPAVCQRGGDCINLIEDGTSGMLCATSAEWEAKLERLIASTALRHEMGQRGLAAIRAEHTLSHVFSKLEAALQGVIEAKQHPAPVTTAQHLRTVLRRAGRQLKLQSLRAAHAGAVAKGLPRRTMRAFTRHILRSEPPAN